MTPDEIGLFEWAFKGIVATIFGIGTWLWSRLMVAVKENRDNITLVDKDLANHKLHVSDNYAKIKMFDDMNKTINDIQKDIKVIIGKLGNGDKHD